MLIINKKINNHSVSVKGVKAQLNRVWLEGKRLGRFVSPGTSLQIKDDAQGVVITFTADDAQRIVSKRLQGGEVVPVIEINESNSDFIASLDSDAVLRIAITKTGIRITPNQQVVDRRIAERETRFFSKRQQNIAMDGGSVFAGGGTFDFEGKKGFDKSGLSTVVKFALDSDPVAVENLCDNVGHVFDDSSVICQSDITLLDFSRDVPLLDILKLTPPCIDASPAGKAKKGNKIETSATAHLSYYYSQIVDKANPNFIILECVQPFMLEASFLVFRALLESWGYCIQVRVIDANGEGFALESRKRMIMVAVSQGLVGVFDLDDVKPLAAPAKKLADILDDVPADHKSWSAKTGLIAKERRDIAAKNGFRMQVFNGTESHIGTLRAQYQKSGSADPLLSHPDSAKKLFRILNQNEHARAMSIDPALVKNRSAKAAHKILGNGLTGALAQSLCYYLGAAIQQIKVVNCPAG